MRAFQKNWTFWITVILAGVPGTITAIRMIALARGNFQVIEIIVESNFAQTIWLSSLIESISRILVIGPLIILVYYCAWHSEAGGRLNGFRRLSAGKFYSSLVVSITYTYLLVVAQAGWNWKAVVFFLVFHPLIFGYPIIWLRRESFKEASRIAKLLDGRSVRRGLSVLSFAMLFIAVYGPAGEDSVVQYVSVRGEPTISVGRVLNVSDVALTLLYREGGIRYIPSSSVDAIYLCSNQEYRRSILFLPSPNKPYRAPECDYKNLRFN